MSSRLPASIPGPVSVAPIQTRFALEGRDVPATLRAARILIEKTVQEVYNLPDGAPNRATIVEEAINLKQSLERAELKAFRLWGLIKSKENPAIIAELHQASTDLEGNILASTAELERLNSEVKEGTVDLMEEIWDASTRNPSMDGYVNEFNEIVIRSPNHSDYNEIFKQIFDERIEAALQNVKDPGPGPGQIISDFLRQLILDTTNGITDEDIAAARQRKRELEEEDQQMRQREWTSGQSSTSRWRG